MSEFKFFSNSLSVESAGEGKLAVSGDNKSLANFIDYLGRVSIPYEVKEYGSGEYSYLKWGKPHTEVGDFPLKIVVNEEDFNPKVTVNGKSFVLTLLKDMQEAVDNSRDSSPVK